MALVAYLPPPDLDTQFPLAFGEACLRVGRRRDDYVPLEVLLCNQNSMIHTVLDGRDSGTPFPESPALRLLQGLDSTLCCVSFS